MSTMSVRSALGGRGFYCSTATPALKAIRSPFRRFGNQQGRHLAQPASGRKSLVSRSPPTAAAGGGGGGGSRIGASKGYGGDGGGDFGGSGQRRPIISLTLAYAVFVAVGGVMGYRKAGSMNSLVSSLVVAAGLVIASNHMKANPASYSGVYAALAIVLVLGGYMAHGWWKKRKAFPQGVTAALSLALASAYAIVLKGPQAV